MRTKGPSDCRPKNSFIVENNKSEKLFRNNVTYKPTLTKIGCKFFPFKFYSLELLKTK